MPETTAKKAEGILTELVTGPSISEVAATFLTPALTTLYPNLKIDPSLATVVTPTWVIAEDRVLCDNPLYESLTDVLVRLGLSGSTVTYIDGEHFLTLQPGVEPAVQLAVKIDAIGCLLNTLAPLLFGAWQQQQLEYWNQQTSPSTPRWHQLSRTLQNIWNVDASTDWSEDEKAIAQAVFNHPDRATRLAQDKYLTKACLIDIDHVEEAANEHSLILDTAVLVGTTGTRTFVLTHSIAEGFRRFDSIEALGDTLLAQQNLQWRLYEPDGDFFRYQACALIALEVDAIGALDTFQGTSRPGHSPHPNSPAKNLADLDALPAYRFSKVQGLLPEWLRYAAPADLTRYSRHLMDIARLREQDAGKTFLDDIPALPDFAVQRLREQMIKDHPTAATLNLEDVEISITSVVVLGTFVVPGRTQTLTLSLVELALQSLIAMPLGNKSVHYKNGEATPSWMTAAYLDKLVTQVDIGATYPALIKRKLLTNPQETSRRQRLYSRHLRLQLPLQALQFKIRGQAGFDERGYRYVVAAMQVNPVDRFVDGLEIIIRPLAFITGDRTDSKADEVANMFVIGPRLTTQGPCVLYRPLLDHPLTQFPGETNLLYAIKHNKDLRQSILAWLPDSVRFDYSQYVFPGELPSVWTLTQLLVEPSSVLGKMGSVTFSTKALDGEPDAALFKANANAMVTLADRQSVSNAEARWATLKRGAWMLFNIALPFLGRTAGTAAWIWQIMDDLQEATDANENDVSQGVWSAMTDLLLTLGMVLAHQAAARNKPSMRQLEKTEAAHPAPKPLPTPKLTVTRLPDWHASQLPASHETSLHSLGALTPNSLGAVLDELSIPEPGGLTAPSLDAGAHQHLSGLNRKWYAKVGQRWVEVMLNENDDVQIIDSRQTPVAKGPLLIHSAKGEWFIDTRLRLRGGGRRKALERANQQRKEELKGQLKAFDSRKSDLKAELETVEKAATDANHQSLIETLDSQLTTYGTYIEQLKTFNSLEPIPNYRPVMVSCLELQLSLTEKWFIRQNRAFGERMRQSLALLDQNKVESTQTPRQIHQLTSDLTQGFIDKIESARARIDELTRLGKEASEVAREFAAQLPKFKLQDLKLFQISMAQELCLNESGPTDMASARQAMERLVEDAGLTIQSSLDLAEDGEILPLPERIGGLSDLVEQFANLDQRIADLPEEFPDQLLTPPLELMRERIKSFNEPTVTQLANLLHERRMLEPTPRPSRPAPIPKRIIKTRFKGTVVGSPRQRAAGDEVDLFDVTSPLTGKVIATFHEKTPGNWLEHVPQQTQAPLPVRLKLDTCMQEGQSLFDQLQPFTRRTESHANQAGRIPVEIEEMFNQQARRMTEAANAIDKALTDMNATDGGPVSAALLAKQLNEGATGLYEKGRLTRISMIKRQPPTAARVEWLQREGLVDIVKTPGRNRLKGHRKDFLEEYEIHERGTGSGSGIGKAGDGSGALLWYAHFHYPKLETPAESYTAAHLKTASQRMLGGGFDLKTATSSNELIAIYRSEISPQLAKALFLPTSKPSSSKS
ncbi:dermonecrotic toxin domain-containing protein [Pseudomonas sp. MDT1-17]